MDKERSDTQERYQGVTLESLSKKIIQLEERIGVLENYLIEEKEETEQFQIDLDDLREKLRIGK